MDPDHPTIDTDYSIKFDDIGVIIPSHPYSYHMFILGRDKLRKGSIVYTYSGWLANSEISVCAYMIDAIGLFQYDYALVNPHSILLNGKETGMLSSVCPFIEI